MHKVMALDIGTKRIGIALSDYLQMLANGVECIDRNPEDKALERIAQLARENNVQKIIVGLPLNMDGSRGEQAQDCVNFASKITGHCKSCGFTVIYEDERLTSETAEENLRSRKIDFRKNKSLVDIESACIILEQYLSGNNRRIDG
jgi:putative Holliday junction resolvase